MKATDIKTLLENAKSINDWIADFEYQISLIIFLYRPWQDKLQNNAGHLFKNALTSIDEWTEQMEVSEQMIKQFINDEMSKSNIDHA